MRRGHARLLVLAGVLLVAALAVNDDALATLLGGGRADHGRHGVVRVGPGVDPRADPRRHPRRRRGRGPRALRRGARRAAGDRHGDRRRCRARPARRHRHGRAGRPRLELLPRPGHLDAPADARVGRLRRDRRAARAAARTAASCSPRSRRCSASPSARAWTSGSGTGSSRTRSARWRRWWAAGSGSTRRMPWGTSLFALVAGPELRRMLDRYGKRLHTEVVWA